MQPPSPLQRTTPKGVKIAEKVAELAIRAGGIGTIAAVTLMMAFLIWVASPLFKGAEIQSETSSATRAFDTNIEYMGLDEEGALAWFWEGEGRLRAVQLANGETFLQEDLFPEEVVTSVCTPLMGEEFTVAFANGTLREVKIGFHTGEIVESDFPEGEKLPGVGENVLIGTEYFERTENGSLRKTELEWEVKEAFEAPGSGAILSVDHVEAATGDFYGLVDSEHHVRVLRVRESENWMTDEIEREIAECNLESVLPARDIAPDRVLVGTGATQVFVIYPDGLVVQLAIANFNSPEWVQSIEIAGSGQKLDDIGFIPGRSTLLAADSGGTLSAWFPIQESETDYPKLTRIQNYTDSGAVLESIAFSHRSRMFLAGLEDGTISAWQSTVGTEVKQFKLPADESILALAFHPRQDGVVALTDKGLHNWVVDFGFPETSLKSMFTPVWYEGYQEPEHVWQSSSSSDDFEPKLGMWPLVFGTIKATLFAMLFGAPIAILAALFTSEYMRGKTRATTKTMVELLAGLPSVVLGFLAALVVAPFVQEHLSRLLSTFFLVPFVLLLGAYLWQMQPSIKRRQRARWQRISAILLCLPLALFLGWLFGPLVENTLFGGDSEAWLDHRHGGAASGWFFLLMPLAAAIVVVLFTLRRSLDPSPGHSIVRFALGVTSTLLIAAGLAFALQGLGFDPRGGILDTYQQRNALVVGIAVGMVVLPIVYTLTEDALNEVPRNLREASLGAGATPWQTAVRVVLPFATSGIFSALMVGLGRAVGETMIVLMAAGNTPLTEWNVFNGFRTLAANIATEIPEAVVGSAHYRALFFTALILFGMTFVINTLAELVRRHFRAKVKAL